MTNFEKLKKAIKQDEEYQVIVKENSTGNTGIIIFCGNDAVKFFNGDDSGKDDKIVSMNEFNNNFTIIDVLDAYSNKMQID